MAFVGGDYVYLRPKHHQDEDSLENRYTAVWGILGGFLFVSNLGLIESWPWYDTFVYSTKYLLRIPQGTVPSSLLVQPPL